jgi:hypothetical protein
MPTASARYRRFVEHVIEQFSGGRRYLDDLPRELIASDPEINAIAENSPRSQDVSHEG